MEIVIIDYIPDAKIFLRVYTCFLIILNLSLLIDKYNLDDAMKFDFLNQVLGYVILNKYIFIKYFILVLMIIYNHYWYSR